MHKQSNGTVHSGPWLSPFLQECFCPLLGWALLVLTVRTILGRWGRHCRTPPSCEALLAEPGEDEYVISLRVNVM